MIPKEKLQEIKDYLHKSENPLFMFDDDPDGLCSYLLLKKYIDKGKGVVIKGPPEIDLNFLRKVEEYSPDFLFVLDKPRISQDFVNKVNVPIIWIDHHPLRGTKGIHHYNPLIWDKNDNRPTTYWCYKITKQNKWIAALGTIGDWYYSPTIIKDFIPKGYKDPAKIIYETEFGRLVKIFAFLLKGKTSDVNKSISILTKIGSPEEILKQTTSKGKFLYKLFEKTEKDYKIMLEKAIKAKTKSNFLIFNYPSSKLSLTAELSNELIYKFPDKTIIIAREKDETMRISLRSFKIDLQKAIDKALIGVEGYGGGHKEACGALVAKKDYDKFIENIKKQLK